MHPSARSLGLEAHGTAAGQDMVKCPFHTDSKPSARYSQKKGLFYCFVCQLGLNVDQLTKRLGLTITLEDWERLNREPEEYNLVSETDFFELGEYGYHSYYNKRGIGVETIKEYLVSMKYTEPVAAVLPITKLNGEVIGAQYRYLRPEEAGTRYKTFGKTTPVWPMHLLKGAQERSLVLVTEGAWSAMRIHTWFLDQKLPPPICLALLGAKANTAIADVLRPFLTFILYDGDKAGKTACRKMRKLWPTAQSWTLSISPDDMVNLQIKEMLDKLDDRWKEDLYVRRMEMDGVEERESES